METWGKAGNSVVAQINCFIKFLLKLKKKPIKNKTKSTESER